MSVKIAELVKKGLHAIRPYEPGRPIEEVERELGSALPEGGAIKLASNENPLGPSPRALEAAHAALAKSNLYPDGGCNYLRRKLAAVHRVDVAELSVGNGSNELIDLVVRAFCGPGDEVLAPERSFLCYQLAAQTCGAVYREVPRRPRFAYDLDALADAATERTKVVFFANPDNPTGAYAATDELRRFLRRLHESVVVVIDEAYHEYATAADYPDSMALRGERELLFTLRTFSKIHGLAGLRCGYGVGPRELVGYLDRVRDPFNVNSIAQAAALAALDDPEHVERARRVNLEGMERLSAGLRALGIDFPPSQCNFLLIDVGPRDGRAVFQALLQHGVIVRPMNGYGLPGHLRVTVGTEAENTRFLDALAAVLRAPASGA